MRACVEEGVKHLTRPRGRLRRDLGRAQRRAPTRRPRTRSWTGRASCRKRSTPSGAWDVAPAGRDGDGRAALPAGRAARRQALGRRAPAGRARAPAPAQAADPPPRRADQPPGRRERAVAGAAPRALRGHGDRRHPRPVLPRQRRAVDPRARPRPRHPVEGELLLVARAEADARTPSSSAPRTAGRRRWRASWSGSASRPRRAACKSQARITRLRVDAQGERRPRRSGSSRS